jgi:hypothetical protein
MSVAVNDRASEFSAGLPTTLFALDAKPTFRGAVFWNLSTMGSGFSSCGARRRRKASLSPLS